jgi:hypothetical protein
MKTTWNMALLALVVLGCIVTWSFAQQLGLPPSTSAAPADNRPGATPPAADPVPAPASSFRGQPPATEEVETVIEVTPDGNKVLRTIRGGGNRYGSPLPYGATMHFTADPDTAKLYAAEEEAAKEAQAIVTRLRSLTDEKGDVEAIKKLREALTKQFDAQQKRRALEVSKIEERLAKLKDTMKKRETAKDTIISRRVDELTGVTDELGWEETGNPGRTRATEAGNYSVPARVPMTPRAFPGGEETRPSR